MNAIWKFKSKFKIINTKNLPQAGTGEFDLSSFTSGKNYMIYKGNFTTGRPWSAPELRIKSNMELHKLWYVLLKEKLALRADFYHYNQKKYDDTAIKTDMLKVKKSMSRVLTVVNERNIINNEFLCFLEFYYIQKQKLKEAEVLRKQKEKLIVLNDDKKDEFEVKEEAGKIDLEDKNLKYGKIKEKRLKNNLNNPKLNHIKNKLENLEKKEEIPVVDGLKASVLTENEIKIVKSLENPIKNKDLLNSYVKNSHLIKGKERKRLISEIRAGRAKQAKEIFTKELMAISYKIKYLKEKRGKTEGKDEEAIKKLENLA